MKLLLGVTSLVLQVTRCGTSCLRGTAVPEGGFKTAAAVPEIETPPGKLLSPLSSWRQSRLKQLSILTIQAQAPAANLGVAFIPLLSPSSPT